MVSFLSSLQPYSDWGLLALRLAIGIIFLYHGTSKLKNIASFFGFIGIMETIGSIAVLAGFLTQLAALGLGIIMLGAIYKKINEWHIPFWAKDNTGWEFDLMILGGCVALLFLGGGSIAVDRELFGL